MMVAVVKVDDQDFDTAFGEAVAEAAKAVEDKPAGDIAVQVVDDAAAKEAADKKAVDDAAAKEVADKKAADDAALAEANKGKTPEEITAEEKAAADKAEADKAVADKAAADERAAAEVTAKTDAEKKAADEKAATEAAETKRKEFEASITPVELTEDEKAAEEKFKKDFPDEYATMVVKMKAAEREQNARVYNATQAVLQQIYKDLAPVAQRSAVDAAEKHATAIRAAHKDFDAVIVNVPAWIKKQPSYLQVAYQKAYDEGSTQDVIDLVARFKAETGNGTAKTAAQIAAEEAAKKEADDKAAKLAADAASGMPVGTRRSAPSTKGAPDPTDYDGAFAEAAASK